MRLTRGEGWWLLRRRIGVTQAAVAMTQAISEDRLRRWEQDKEAAPMPAVHGSTELSPGEWCALQRRRRGWTLPEAAGRMGISRVTLWKAENGRTSGVEGVRRFYERIGPARPTAAAPIQLKGPT